MVCFVFSISNILKGNFSGFTNIAAFIISLYIPVVLTILIRKYLKTKDSGEFLFSINICLISVSEWITTIILIYGLMFILNISINPLDFLSVYVSAIIVAVISMTPGGIGTFDLALLLGLGNYGVPSEQVLLLILLYRISYYLIPMLIGMILYSFELCRDLSSKVRTLLKDMLAVSSHFILLLILLLIPIWILMPIIKVSIIPTKIIYLFNKVVQKLLNLGLKLPIISLSKAV